MIAARMTREDGQILILLVLEPGNIEKLKRGEPVHKFLNEFMPELRQSVELLFAYTPDAVWVANQMKGKPFDSETLADVLQESLARPPVVVRDRTAEEMKKFQ